VGLIKAFLVQKQQRTRFFKLLSPDKPLVQFIYQMVPNVLSPGEHSFNFIFGCVISSGCRNIDFKVNLWYGIDHEVPLFMCLTQITHFSGIWERF